MRGVRLLDHLKALGHGNRDARALLSSGKVWLRGCPTGDAGREVEPAEVEIRLSAPKMVMGRDPIVLWRDTNLMIVWKPSGLLSVPAPHRDDESNLLAWVGKRFGSAFPVHRLDEGTSGCMMVALKVGAQEALKDLLERHAIERHYLAIVHGDFRHTMTMRNLLVRDRGDGRRGSGFDGKPAVTHLRPIEALRGATIVGAQLETGRTHQVRIHLSELGHPVFGDDLYGGARGGRLALHASHLAFVHPFTKAPIEVHSPLADDLEALRRSLLLPR